MTNRQYDIAVVGDWHLAFCTASVLASTGHKVALVKPLNLNNSRWSEFPPIPVMEPGLNEMIADAKSKGLLHHENGVSSEWQAKYVWMAVDTPVNDKDEPDTAPLLQIIKDLKETQKGMKVFMTSSQIPMGFCDTVRKDFSTPMAYIPENLRLGKGIETFFKADRTVIGGSTPETAEEVKSLMKSFPTEFVLCNLVTAEMVKHANNIFLATSISFANELARLGEKFNVDSQMVAKALKLDKRIGMAAYVAPGLGFAGGTLPRDLRVIQKLGKEQGVPTQLVDSVLQVNENTTAAIADIVQDRMKEKKSSAPVLILGYTYKPDTDTLRRSLSIDLAKELKAKNIKVYGFDPVMNGKDLTNINGLIEHFNSLTDIKEKPEVVLLMTSRPAFKEIKWADLNKQWALKSDKKSMVLDTQNFLDAVPAREAGFDFKKLWSPYMPGSLS